MTHTLLSCPACAAQYNIANTALSPTGRRVKCTACGYSWQAFMQVEPSLAETISEPTDMAVIAPEVFNESDTYEPTTQESAALLAQALSRQGINVENSANNGASNATSFLKIISVTFVTMFVIIGASVLLLRSPAGVELAQSYPRLIPVLQMFGTHVPVLGEGLVFENVAVTRKNDNNSLVIEGQWRNRSAKGVVVPHMQAALLANTTDTAPIKTWPIRQTPRTIAPQGVAKFQYELADAPANGAHIKLNFVDKIQ